MSFRVWIWCCLLVTWPQAAGLALAPDQFVVWNVGQGQWATWAVGLDCFHFDMGGERADWTRIQSLCRGRANRVYFSHWDLDHINFAARAKRFLPDLCIAASPGGAAASERTARLRQLPACSHDSTERWSQATAAAFASNSCQSRSNPNAVNRIHEVTPSQRITRDNSNDSSRIFILDDHVALPGDASAAIERRLPERELRQVSWLVLGHHGSRTSTSPTLLRRLPALALAIASARRQRYGHPHPSVMERLRDRGVALLITEDWGHVRLQWPPRRKCPTHIL